MSAQLIDALEHELATMLARVGAVQACLEALKLGATGGRTTTASDARGRNAERRGHSSPRPRGRAKSSATDAAIVAAIKAGHTTTKAIVAETNLPDYNVRQALKRLVKAKAITKTGATSSLRYAAK